MSHVNTVQKEHDKHKVTNEISTGLDMGRIVRNQKSQMS